MIISSSIHCVQASWQYSWSCPQYCRRLKRWSSQSHKLKNHCSLRVPVEYTLRRSLSIAGLFDHCFSSSHLNVLILSHCHHHKKPHISSQRRINVTAKITTLARFISWVYPYMYQKSKNHLSRDGLLILKSNSNSNTIHHPILSLSLLLLSAWWYQLLHCLVLARNYQTAYYSWLYPVREISL